MGFFKKKDGGKDYSFQEWSELETGWGKSKYIGREIKTVISFLIGVFIILTLMGSRF
jgi:hypothetical protein